MSLLATLTATSGSGWFSIRSYFDRRQSRHRTGSGFNIADRLTARTVSEPQPYHLWIEMSRKLTNIASSILRISVSLK
jgi:hypothetical protein